MILTRKLLAGFARKLTFSKGDILIPFNKVYPDGAILCDGYESDGTLLGHPVGGGLQYRLKAGSEGMFRAVGQSEIENGVWKQSTFSIEGIDGGFVGWTDGRHWNGWAMPCFEFSESQRVIAMMDNPNSRYGQGSDAFVTTGGDGEEEIWMGRWIEEKGGERIKVYPVGAGSWIWDPSA